MSSNREPPTTDSQVPPPIAVSEGESFAPLTFEGPSVILTEYEDEELRQYASRLRDKGGLLFYHNKEAHWDYGKQREIFVMETPEGHPVAEDVARSLRRIADLPYEKTGVRNTPEHRKRAEKQAEDNARKRQIDCEGNISFVNEQK